MAKTQNSLVYFANQKKTLRESVKILKHRDMAIHKTLEDIKEVSRKLELERNEILLCIDKSVTEIRRSLNEVVEKIHHDLEENHQKNLQILHKNEAILSDKLKACKQDIIKCEDLLTDSIPSAELKVNKIKVFDMVIGSVEKNTYTPPPIELHRMKLDKATLSNDMKRNIEMIIGTFMHSIEKLGEIQHPVTLHKSLRIPNTEVNAMALNSDDKRTKSWACAGVSNELVCYNDLGAREKTITTDFEINDVAVSVDNRIYVTSPDSHVWRCLKLTRSGGFVQLFAVKDELHLHTVTLCRYSKTIAVCGTDRPNYSNQNPNEVVIITYSPEGKEIKRLAVSNFSGKVYRIAVNSNNNYVLTFPKEGLVLSVDHITGQVKSFFDKKDFRLSVTNQLKVTNSNDFWPSGVCCDPHGNIYVTEYLEKVLLMLDYDCCLLRYIGGGYSCPNAVCFHDSSCLLWLADKGKLFIWEVHDKQGPILDVVK